MYRTFIRPLSILYPLSAWKSALYMFKGFFPTRGDQYGAYEKTQHDNQNRDGPIRLDELLDETVSSKRLLLRPGHHQADVIFGDLVLFVYCHNTPFADGCNAVAKIHDLIKLEGDQQDGPALLSLGDDPLSDVLNRSDVQSPGGLCHHQDFRGEGNLPGNDDLLLVSP